MFARSRTRRAGSLVCCRVRFRPVVSGWLSRYRSSSRDSPPAFRDCRCRPGDKPNPQQLCADDIRAVVAAGNPQPHKRSAPDESPKRRRNNGKTCTAAEPCLQSGAIPFQSEMCRNDLETAVECYRVFANWGAFPQTPLGGRAAPRIPPAKTPATGAPSNRPARCNPSAALTDWRATCQEWPSTLRDQGESTVRGPIECYQA